MSTRSGTKPIAPRLEIGGRLVVAPRLPDVGRRRVLRTIQMHGPLSIWEARHVATAPRGLRAGVPEP